LALLIYDFGFNPPLIYSLSRIRNILSQMSPSEISSYLSANILTIGISSITRPWCVYLSMGTIKCVSNACHTQNVSEQCSGVLIPQQSICVFLLFMMVAKVVIAPLSTTNLTTKDIIKLNLPRRLIFEGTLYGLSFLLNLYLFANIEQKEASHSIWTIASAAMLLALTPLCLEFSHMVFHHAYRTTLFPLPPPPQHPTSTPSSEITLSPVDSLSPNPTEGCTTNAFV